MSPKAKPKPPVEPAPEPATGPLRLAHRGDWRLAPENSLEALVFAAGTAGVDGVEFDVRLAKDGVPVLLHDETLERVQGRDAAAADLTAAELREAGIPSLAEVLAALPKDVFLDVELKGPGHAEATADVLRLGRGKAPKRAVVSSFDETSLRSMAALLPGWPRWLNATDLGADTIETATGLGCRAVAVQWKAITAASLKAARAASLDVAAWTVTRPPTVARRARRASSPCASKGRRSMASGHAGSRAREALVLEAGDVRATILPDVGGRVGSLLIGGRELIVTGDPDRMRWGSYPMVPFAGRIRHGRFSFLGADHQLPLGSPPHAIHGVVWDRPWRVEDDTALSIELDERWPYRGRVTQRFALDADALRFELILEAAEPMPATIGWHPWFRRVLVPGEPPVEVDLAADEMLVRDAEGMPSGQRSAPPPGPWDDAFTGLRRDPALVWPGRLRLTLSSSCPWWIVYTAPEHSVCVEPQSGPPDAVNGVPEVVQPGSPLVHTMRWGWDPLD